MGAVGGNFKKKLSNQLDEKTPSSQVARQLWARWCVTVWIREEKKGASSSKLEMECVLCERSSSRIKISLTSWIGICFPPVGRFITDNKMATVGASHKLAQEPYSLLSLLLATYWSCLYVVTQVCAHTKRPRSLIRRDKFHHSE
jgi:hypothetical protein